MNYCFSIFDTAIGSCGIVWSTRGIAGVQVHDGNERATRARLLRRFAGAREMTPPAHVQHAIDGIVALLRGEPRDLSDVTIDVDGLPEFNRKVYGVARTIPPGATLTYG
jgi:methylated-DNA-[protein]-cysteine S-methyltransferase